MSSAACITTHGLGPPSSTHKAKNCSVLTKLEASPPPPVQKRQFDSIYHSHIWYKYIIVDNNYTYNYTAEHGKASWSSSVRCCSHDCVLVFIIFTQTTKFEEWQPTAVRENATCILSAIYMLSAICFCFPACFIPNVFDGQSMIP